MKINSIVYKKLMAQAEEAKEQQIIKLSDAILNAIGSYSADEKEEYSYTQLKKDIYQDMWKIATRLISYHDLQTINANQLGQTLEACASEVLDELELTLGMDEVIKSSLEPKTPGENQ